MLVETDARRKREIRRDANEHPAPVTIVHVEVVLHHPTLGQLQVPAIVLFVSDSGQNTGWLSCLQDDNQLVVPSMAKARLDNGIATTCLSFQDAGIPFLASVRYRILTLF